MCKAKKLGRLDIAGGASQVTARGRKVVGVDGGEEGSAGNKLHIVPSLTEDETGRRGLNIASAFLHARAQEIFSLLLVPLEHRRVVSRSSLQ